MSPTSEGVHTLRDTCNNTAELKYPQNKSNSKSIIVDINTKEEQLQMASTD